MKKNRLKEIEEEIVKLTKEADEIIDTGNQFSSCDIRAETGFNIYELVKKVVATA